MFDYENFRHVALSAIGAIILTTVSGGAAVGPARAIETTPNLFAQADAGTQANG